ncbi:MAG: hypothetical protein J6B98_06965 [Bacilli bacterium]|nr:hypothetical protein [Bacilli bacterium]
MENKKYLTEENYESGKKKIKTIALIILIVGVLIGGSLIVTGLVKQGQTNSQYSEESKNNKKDQLEKEKQQLTQELDAEKQNLLTSKTTLENKIKPVEDEIKKLEREKTDVFMNGGFSDRYYEIEDKIEDLKESTKIDENSLSVIEDALDESFNHCSFSETKNNTYTSKYCSLKNEVAKKDAEIAGLDLEFSDFNKEFNSFDSIPLYMIGGFIILASGMISFSMFMFSKRREIMAFTAQQVMPVAQEGIEKMAPTIGKAGANIAKEMAPVYKDMVKEISPVYVDIAKEISKGIKEGLKESDSEEEQE